MSVTHDNIQQDKEVWFTVITSSIKDFEEIWKRDEETEAALTDGQVITFYRNNYKSDQTDIFNFEESDDESLDERVAHMKYLYYEEFTSNKFKIQGLNLNDGEDVVLASTKMHIYFQSPMCPGDETMVTIEAKDKNKGFTREDLAQKIMLRYHMLYFMYRNYDMENGCTKDDAYTCFKPLLYESDWSENGLSHITYNKNKGYWVFEPIWIH